MKEIFIDKMNNDRNGPDDTDWNAPEIDSAGYTEADRLADNYYQNQYGDKNIPDNEPPYIAVSSDGKRCWEIKSIKEDVTYRIWALSYKEALELLPKIESF